MITSHLAAVIFRSYHAAETISHRIECDEVWYHVTSRWWTVISHHKSHREAVIWPRIMLFKRDEVVLCCVSKVYHHLQVMWYDITPKMLCRITSHQAVVKHHITLLWSETSHHISCDVLYHIDVKLFSSSLQVRCVVTNHITVKSLCITSHLAVWWAVSVIWPTKWCDVLGHIMLFKCDETCWCQANESHHIACMHHASRCEEDLAVVPSKCAVLSYAMKLWCACMTKQRCAVPMLMRSSNVMPAMKSYRDACIMLRCDEVICRCYAGVVLVNEVLCQAKQCCDIFVLLIWSCYAVETLLCRCEALRWRKVMPSKWNDIMLLVSRCYSLAQQHRCASEWCVMLQAKRCYVLC